MPVNLVHIWNARHVPHPVHRSLPQQRTIDALAPHLRPHDADISVADWKRGGLHLHHRHAAQSICGLRLYTDAVPGVTRRLTNYGLVAATVALSGACSTGASGSNGAADLQPSAPGIETPGDPTAGEQFDYDTYLTVLQEASGLPDPPATELVRVIAPAEQPQVWLACMQEDGWDVSVTPDGGLSPPEEVADDQWPAFDLSDYTCHAEYPVDQSLAQPFATAQVDILYGYYVQELLPCLQQRGHEVPEPPSIDVFRASWVAGDRGAVHAGDETWYPYAGVDVDLLTMEEWDDLNRACPQNPPDDVLFPSDEPAG